MANHNEEVHRVIVENKMNIPLGEHFVLSADSLNYIIYRKVNGKSKDRLIVEGYFSSLEGVLSALLERKLKESEITTLNSLKKAFNSVKGDIRTYCDTINSYVKDS